MTSENPRLQVVSSHDHPAPQPLPNVRSYYSIVPTVSFWERLTKAWHVFRGVADDHIVDNSAKAILRFHPSPQLAHRLAGLRGFPQMEQEIEARHGEGFFLIEGRNPNDLRLVQFGYWPFPQFRVKGVGAKISFAEYVRRYKTLEELGQQLLDFRNGVLLLRK